MYRVRPIEPILDPGAKSAELNTKLTAPGEGLSSRFPVSIELPPVSALSAALVGQRSWNSPLVQEEAMNMLGDPERARALYMNWQAMAARQAIEIFQHVKLAERRLYGENSFFLWRDSHPGEPIPLRDPDPAPEWDKINHDQFCG